MKLLKSFHKIKYALLLLLSAVCLILSAVAVCAEDKASVSYSYAVSGVEFKLYKVADITGNGKTGRFNSYPVDLEDTSAAQTLALYVARDDVEPVALAVTGEDKVAVFEGLDKGIYLIVGDSIVKDNLKYEALPVLALVNDEDVTINGKFETESISEGSNDTPSSSTTDKTPTDSSSTSTDDKTPNDSSSTSEKTPSNKVTTSTSTGGGGGSSSSVNPKELSVLKVWKGDSGESEITAQLLRNGKVYDEVALNDDNNWRYTWKNLGRSYTWSVVEKSVPDGYSVSIQKDGSVYVITNTAEGYEEKETPIPNNPDDRDEPLYPVTPNDSDNPNSSDVTEDSTDKISDSDSTDKLDKSGDVSEDNNNDTIKRDDKSQNDNAVSSQSLKTEKLPQTGQLWLPAIALAFAGVLLVIIGIGRRRMDR